MGRTVGDVYHPCAMSGAGEGFSETISVVLCIDGEPDPRTFPTRSPEPCRGLERLVVLVPGLRDRLSEGAGSPAAFTWCVRVDPQIAEAYGSSTWLLAEYEWAWSQFREAGDAVGVHPHTWRWRDGWVADNADAGWVAHCCDVAIDGYRQAFGEAPQVHKHGDGFMTTALARRLDDRGVLVDLSLEPGRRATRTLAAGEETTGWLPDLRAVPQSAYRPSPGDFRVPDDARHTGMVMLPLTSGVTLALTEVRSRVVGAGEYVPLWLWREPDQFRAMLQVRLSAPDLTHLAFAVRSDTTLSDDLWTNVETNLAEIGRQLKGRHRWCCAQSAATTAIERSSGQLARVRETTTSHDANVGQWLRGRADPGYREHVDLESLAIGPGHPLSGQQPDTATLDVSAILPVYQGRRHLRHAVYSVVDQTTPPIELIVVDDGSTADDLDFLNGVAAPFPIRIARQDNSGQSAARNAGVGLAAGALVAFLDQDDIWLPEHLETLCKPFETDPAVAWSYGEFDEIDSDGRVVTRAYLRQHSVDHPKNSLAECLAHDLMVPPSASVIRRDAFIEVGGFDEQLRGFEDDDLYVRAFRSGWQFSFQRTPVTRFRVHQESDSDGPNFAASRRRYAEKLQDTVRDDRRTGRYYMRDVVSPRFFQASLDDYVRRVSFGDWASAQDSLRDLRYFGRLRRDWVSLRWKLWLISRPRFFAHMLSMHDVLPMWLRMTENPAIRRR